MTIRTMPAPTAATPASWRTSRSFADSALLIAVGLYIAVAIAEEGAQLGLVSPDVKVTPIATHEYPTPARRPAYSVLDKSSLTSKGFKQQHWRHRGVCRARSST